jgi:hypothetical protein
MLKVLVLSVTLEFLKFVEAVIMQHQLLVRLLSLKNEE